MSQKCVFIETSCKIHENGNFGSLCHVYFFSSIVHSSVAFAFISLLWPSFSCPPLSSDFLSSLPAFSSQHFLSSPMKCEAQRDSSREYGTQKKETCSQNPPYMKFCQLGEIQLDLSLKSGIDLKNCQYSLREWKMKRCTFKTQSLGAALNCTFNFGPLL